MTAVSDDNVFLTRGRLNKAKRIARIMQDATAGVEVDFSDPFVRENLLRRANVAEASESTWLLVEALCDAHDNGWNLAVDTGEALPKSEPETTQVFNVTFVTLTL